MHRVTPVRAGKEERVSLVFCFSTVNAFGEDAMRTLPVYGDPENISAWEIARHYSWKTSGMLKYIMEERRLEKLKQRTAMLKTNTPGETIEADFVD